MKYTILFLLFFSILEGRAQHQDSLDVLGTSSRVVQDDSSSLLSVLQNRPEFVLSPVLFAQNKGALQLSVVPRFDFTNWYSPSLPFVNGFYSRQHVDSAITEANYSYGLNDSHLFGATFKNKIGKNFIHLNYLRNTSTGLINNTDIKQSNFQIDLEKNTGIWQYEFGYNNVNSTVQENGGSDSLFLAQAEEINAFTIPVHLNTASNELKRQLSYFNNTFYFIRNSSLLVDTLDTIIHPSRFSHGVQFYLRADKSQFTFEMDQSDVDSLFFEAVFLDSLGTKDSIGYVAVGYGLGYIVLDTLDRERVKLSYHDNRYDWSVLDESSVALKAHSYLGGHTIIEGKFILTGYRKSFRKLSLIHKLQYKKNLLVNVEVNSTKGQVAYNLLNYTGNHFNWNNNFEDQGMTAGKVRVFHKRRQLGAQLDVAQVQDYVYLNASSVPEQYLGNFSYYKASLYHLFQSKYIRLYTKGMYQSSSSNVIRFPSFSLASTFVYAFRIGKLRSSLGFQASYFSAYYGLSYNPNLRQMYLQDNTKVGGFPLLDVFAAVKIGGADVFVKWENILFGTYSREFYLYPNYITVPRMLRVGLNWKFLN